MPEGKTDLEDAIRVDVLDNIAANLDIKHIDLIMMDIDAHEIYALEGMKEMLSKHLIIEVHPKILQQIGKTDAEVIQILENSGYKIDKFHKESEAAYHVTPIPRSLSIFTYFLILLILVVPGDYVLALLQTGLPL